MVLAMCMVAVSGFRYSAPLVPWTDAELDKLHVRWFQIHLAASQCLEASCYPSAPPAFPCSYGGVAEVHQEVQFVQALAKHIEQRVCQSA